MFRLPHPSVSVPHRRQTPHLAAALLAALLTACPPAFAADPTGVDQTLFPDKDGQTVSSNSNNKGALTTMRIGFDPEDKSEYRVLIHFDLAALKKQPVAMAYLRLHAVNGHHGTTPKFIRIHPLYRDWDEAKFLWTGPNATEAWFKEGGDVLPQACGGGTPPKGYSGESLNMWYTFDITAQVQKWQSGAMKNYGVSIMMEAGSDIWITYDSKEATNNRPQLLISYGPIITITDPAGILSGSGFADLDVKPVLNPVILNTEMKRAFADLAYEDFLRIRGGEKPYKFEWVGSAPPGFSIDAGSGKITGTPTKPGNAVFRVKVTGADKKSSTANLKMVIEPPQGNPGAAAVKPVDKPADKPGDKPADPAGDKPKDPKLPQDDG